MVSIVTVNYNSRDLLRNCLLSLEKHVRVPYEVIVVDNSSSDGSTMNLPCGDRVRLIFNRSNVGFSRGCNRGARAAQGRILHFLNPDTEVNETINDAYSAALNAREGCTFTTQLADPAGQIEKTFHVMPTLRDMFYLLTAPEKARYWHIGASVLIEPELFWKIGGFSEEYFMYCEDIDFFYKCQLAGIPNRVLPAVIIHQKGGCSRNVWSAWQRLDIMEKSAFIFSEKFGLRLDYFLFKHLAFLRNVGLHPTTSFMGLETYWRTWLSKILISNAVISPEGTKKPHPDLSPGNSDEPRATSQLLR